jgi:hypothetical protein
MRRLLEPKQGSDRVARRGGVVRDDVVQVPGLSSENAENIGLRKKSPQIRRCQGCGGEGHHQQLVASRNARMGSAEQDRTYHAGACKRHGICPPPQRIRSHHDLQPARSAPQCRKPSLNERTHARTHARTQGHLFSSASPSLPPSLPPSPLPDPLATPLIKIDPENRFIELAHGNRVYVPLHFRRIHMHEPRDSVLSLA